jgi:type I restriction enzyme M protein
MANERKTEKLVRDTLTTLGYYQKGISVWEQQCDNPKIDKLLKYASKKGGSKGYPEFIIQAEIYTELIIVIECKASPQKHQSKTLNKYSEYAVDGALLYSSFLSKEFDVIAIAVSGETKSEMTISQFLHLKKDAKAEVFASQEILPFDAYYNSYINDDRKFKQDYENLLSYTKELNDLLHIKKIKESHRSLLISGILIALQDSAFRNSYNRYTKAKDLAGAILFTINTQLENSDIPRERIAKLESAYSFISSNTTLTTNKTFFESLIYDIDSKVNSFIRTHKYFDTLGQFYIEFLRYANNDKGLGIVLTPPHITELFCDLAQLNIDSIILDNCCGTGGFLISGMQKMISLANNKKNIIERIKREQIIGIEFQDDIYTLAVSNMIIHNDGKSNVLLGDCFDEGTATQIIENFIPNVGLLNPPYAIKKNDIEEFAFIWNNLELLQKGGKCIAIVPMSCALAQSGRMLSWKKRLLEQHTLEAVMSMPSELFHNSKVGVVTCIMIFTAHIPHPKGKKTWFGYWKNDEFVKVKNKGRIDAKGKWNEVKERWVKAYMNKEVIAGHSVMKQVNAMDEWCAEAYMETDYSNLEESDFKANILSYLSFSILQEDFDILRQFLNNPSSERNLFRDKTWEWIEIQTIFDIKKGKRLTKANMTKGQTPFIGSIDSNNGYREFISRNPIHSGNTITVNYNGSVAEAFYQPQPFWASDDVNVLYPKFALDPFIALFIVTIIKMERYRFNFGRKWHVDRMNISQIKLPVDSFGTPDFVFMRTYIKSILSSTSIIHS